MVWHHCYISLPYAAVYLTLWRTVVGFAPSQRRSKRFDSPTIRLPSAETRGRLACQRRRRRRNPYPASALEEAETRGKSGWPGSRKGIPKENPWA